MKRYLIFILALIAMTSAHAQQVFSKLNIASSGTVYVKQDSLCSVKDESGNTVNATVEGDKLILSKSEAVYVTLPKLDQVTVNGAGKVVGQNQFSNSTISIVINGTGKIELDVNVNSISAAMPGMGKIVLTGQAQSSDFSVAGSGKIDASGLKVERSNVSIAGMGKCIVDPSEELNANVSGTGKIEYKTRPKTLNENVSGLGKVGPYDGSSSSVRDTTVLSFGDTDVLIVGKEKKDDKKEDEKARPIWAGVELGLNSFMDASNSFTLKPGISAFEPRIEKTVSFSINFAQKNIQFGKSNVWLVTGLGINWNNYKFEKNVNVVNGDVVTAFRDTSANLRYIKSKLTASYLTAPLMISVLTSKDAKKAFHIAAGGIFGLRLGSHTKMKIDEDGDTRKVKEFDDFNLNPFRYGFRVAIGYGKFNLFADYYASQMFKDKKGPELYPVSAGITLVGF